MFHTHRWTSVAVSASCFTTRRCVCVCARLCVCHALVLFFADGLCMYVCPVTEWVRLRPFDQFGFPSTQSRLSLNFTYTTWRSELSHNSICWPRPLRGWAYLNASVVMYVRVAVRVCCHILHPTQSVCNSGPGTGKHALPRHVCFCRPATPNSPKLQFLVEHSQRCARICVCVCVSAHVCLCVCVILMCVRVCVCVWVRLVLIA
jgi:hypothetical protein